MHKNTFNVQKLGYFLKGTHVLITRTSTCFNFMCMYLPCLNTYINNMYVYVTLSIKVVLMYIYVLYTYKLIDFYT